MRAWYLFNTTDGRKKKCENGKDKQKKLKDKQEELKAKG